jgi:hypothetical protein
VLTPSSVDLDHGACGLWIPGKPHEQELYGSLPANVAGYEEDGPFTCGRCEYFYPPTECERVAGKVASKGCCNAWEKA